MKQHLAKRLVCVILTVSTVFTGTLTNKTESAYATGITEGMSSAENMASTPTVDATDADPSEVQAEGNEEMQNLEDSAGSTASETTAENNNETKADAVDSEGTQAQMAESEQTDETVEVPLEESHDHQWGEYVSNEDGSHTTHCTVEGCKETLREECTFDENGVCTLCGYTDLTKAVIQMEYMTLTDGKVTVEGNLPKGSTLSVSKISNWAAKGLIDDNDKTILVAYDIAVLFNGEEIALDEAVKVTIDAPWGVNTEKLDENRLELLHVKDENHTETVDVDINPEGDFEFAAESFSSWVITLNNAEENIDYVEKADGKTFSQTVRVNFSDASLITRDQSEVTITLYGNIRGESVKTASGTSTDVMELASQTVTVTNYNAGSGDVRPTAYVTYTFSNIPTYVVGKTGSTQSGGNGSYQIPSGFYGVKVQSVPGYTPTTGGDSYVVLNPVKNDNDAIWSTSTVTIENNIMALSNPTFSVEWLDNRNYADHRPYTTGSSINSGSESAIANKIGLYYKEGTTYTKVEDDSPILVTSGSDHPELRNSTFGTWNFVFHNLPTGYDWYIKPEEDFFNDGTDHSAYYQLSNLNG
ncbi:MAG: hypothetical protein K5853_06430, partial [Lachnospiraceae bacterium]|nr:hypothetical protein [Lachnospiraceae bacterium]